MYGDAGQSCGCGDDERLGLKDAVTVGCGNLAPPTL
jgi:hypothetical protein